MLHNGLERFQANAETLVLFPYRIQANENARWMSGYPGTASDDFAWLRSGL